MAGESHLPVKPGRRKQWNINGPITRIDSLIDGTPDSQVVLGKKLLSTKCDDEEDEEENARLGVYWLIKASEQGHEEATRILKHCLETGKGIDGHNIGDVTTCLAMSQDEKVSRHAARELFASLSKGEDFITSDQLSEEMLRVQDRAKRSKGESSGENGGHRIGNNHHRIYNGTGRREKLTEDVLVSAASRVARGELPLVHRTLTLERSNSGTSCHRPVTQRIAAYFTAPFRQIRSSYAYLVDSVGQRPMISFSPVTMAGLKTLLLVWLASLVGLDGFLAALPSIAYFTTLIVMLISTCQVIAKKWESNHFKQWSNLLVAWGGDGVNGAEAQWAYCRNNITPYYVFLGSLLLNLTLSPFVGAFTIPHSEIVVLSTLCSVLTLYTFAWANGKLDSLALLSFGINLLARYPYETDAVVSQGWRFLDVHVPTFASYIVGSGVEFCLNFRLLFYLVMPVIFVRMTATDGWRGVYTRLVPHCVALAWWQMAVIASNGATWYGLIRSCLAVVGLVLFLPLAGLASVFLPMAAVVKLLTTEHQVLPLTPSAAFALALLVTAIYIGRRQRSTSTTRVINWIQVGLGILSVILLLGPILNPSPDDGLLPRSTPLTWSQYQRHCGNSREEGSSMVATQERCAVLTGLFIHWEGRVISARVARIFNPVAVIVSKLPVSMQGVVACMWGEHYEDCTKNKEDCSAPPGLHNKCHLSKWNRYEYEIVMAMPAAVWGGEECPAILIADSPFANFSRDLTVDDRIWFSGSLVGDQLTGVPDLERPRVYLHQAGCLTCRRSVSPSTVVNSSVPSYTLGDAVAALKSVLNFLFKPLLIFK